MFIKKYFDVSCWSMDWLDSRVDSPKGLATWFMYSNQKHTYKMPWKIANSMYAVYIKHKHAQLEPDCRVGHTTNGLVQRDRSYLHSYYNKYSRERPSEKLTVENTDSCVLCLPKNDTPGRAIYLLEELLIRDLDPTYNDQRPTKLIESGILHNEYGIPV